jgi:DNA-binding MarR family transcriptional regulator
MPNSIVSFPSLEGVAVPTSRLTAATGHIDTVSVSDKLVRVQMNSLERAMDGPEADQRMEGGDELGAFSLAQAIGHLLRRCQQSAVDIFVEEVGVEGPTPRQFAILISVFQNAGLNQTDLVRLSGIDRSTLAEILGRLVDRGLIRRERKSADQRTNALYITPAGEAMLRKAFPGMVRAQERIFAPIPPERRGEVVAALEALAGLNGETR